MQKDQISVLVTLGEEKEANPFFKDLHPFISKQVNLTYSIFDFWAKKGNHSIVHIHWPELLTLFQEPSEIELFLLKDEIFPFWKKKAKVIVTRHNYHPHTRKTERFEKLYNIVYRNADAIIHMGAFSKQEYHKRYPDFAGNQTHVVIPHVLYRSFPNDIDQEKARNYFKIPVQAKVILVFGSIRSKEELRFILDVFKKMNVKQKYLLIARHPTFPAPSKTKLLQYLKWRFSQIRIKLDNRIIKTSGFIPREQVQFYFQASDLVFIPRLKGLNSGNIPLGFAFEKVVVGPDTGNIGEVLKEATNPTFSPGDSKDAAEAIRNGFIQSERQLGKENYRFGEKYWAPEIVAGFHAEIYREVLGI